MAEKKKMSKRKKIIIICVICALCVISGVAGVLAAKMNLFSLKFEEDTTDDVSGFSEGYEDVTDAEQEFAMMNEVRGVSSLSDLLKAWATSDGEKMSSGNVLNVLIVGADNRTTDSVGLTDTMILVSVDRKNDKITLSSFYRDSYTYINASGDRYAKLNAAYPNAGASCLINTIESDYKIKIDYYVVVDFQTFEDVVDAVGGVTLDVQEYEAKAIMSDYDIDCPYGEGVTLNGFQALCFCRIRHCDSDADVSRTRRQREFITALIQKSKTVNADNIGEIITSLTKYVKTDCSTSTIISLATKAVAGKWYDFAIQQMQMPPEDCRYGYTLNGNTWVWIVDYPYAAQQLQNAVYGRTNITLSSDRTTAIDLIKKSGSSSGSSSGSKVTSRTAAAATTSGGGSGEGAAKKETTSEGAHSETTTAAVTTKKSEDVVTTKKSEEVVTTTKAEPATTAAATTKSGGDNAELAAND